MNGRANSKLRMVLLLAAELLGVLGLGSFGQTTIPPATKTPMARADSSVPAELYAPTMTFDVASVRESKVDLAQGITVSGGWDKESSVLRVNNFSFSSLLALAYANESYYDVTGIPDALNRAIFNIQAKGDADADAKLAAIGPKEMALERLHMMQELLAVRFHLKAHWETTEGQIYNLVVVKPGKLMDAKNGPPRDEDLKFWGDHPIPPLFQRGSSSTAFDYIAHGCSIEDIAEMLAGQFGRPVIDKTGLRGKYDFVIHTHETRNRDRDAEDTSPYPTLEEAIRNELGLKLVPVKGRVPLLVIDRAEMPSGN